MVDLADKYPSIVLDYHAHLGIPKDVPIGNISFCNLHDGTRLMSIREFAYRLTNARYCPLKGNCTQGGGCHFVVANKDFGFLRRVSLPADTSKLEDFRLMRFGDRVQASFTDVSNGWSNLRISVWELVFRDPMLTIEASIVFPWAKEKNYMPVEGSRGFFVTDLGEKKLSTTEVSSVPSKKIQPCIGLIPYRGSTPLVSYKDGYVAVVHRRQKMRFFNAFAFFDRELSHCKISDEFTVFSRVSPVSFCCGISIENGKAILPFCINDAITRLFALPLTDFERTARARTLSAS